MCALEMFEQTNEVQPRQPEVETVPGQTANRISRLVKAEANFLRFPFFALDTKRLKTLDGIECRGTLRRAGQDSPYMLRITRNTASLYPGPLARKIHFALLSMATEKGFPVQNPITWRWRDLCRRMDIVYGGGTTLRQLKAAIRSTHGVVIHTEQALINRLDKKPLPAIERGYHLYSDYIFAHEPASNGQIADINGVWFADWYLQNLNNMHSAPLDYGLWQSLDQESPIASRLYEFLLLNFYAGIPVLRINYPYLATLLPVRPERYLSKARRQMEPALSLLQETRILADVQWAESKTGEVQLNFRRGPVLSFPMRSMLATELQPEELRDEIEVKELRNLKSPEWFLVSEFYRQWTGTPIAKPTSKELQLAQELIAEHGKTKATAIVSKIVKQLKVQWPDAKTFHAICRYLPEVTNVLDRKKRREDRQKEENRQLDDEAEKAAHTAKQQAALKNMWNGLSEDEQREIRNTVLAAQSRSTVKFPRLVESFCLNELARRQAL